MSDPADYPAANDIADRPMEWTESVGVLHTWVSRQSLWGINSISSVVPFSPGPCMHGNASTLGLS